MQNLEKQHEDDLFRAPVWTYDSPTEDAIVRDFKAAGWTIVNPNAPEHQAAYAERGMAYFTELVVGCNALCYLGEDDKTWEFMLGGETVGAGVAKEILEALVHGKTVETLVFSNKIGWYLIGHAGMPDTILTIDQTRARRAEMLARWAA